MSTGHLYFLRKGFFSETPNLLWPIRDRSAGRRLFAPWWADHWSLLSQTCGRSSQVHSFTRMMLIFTRNLASATALGTVHAVRTPSNKQQSDGIRSGQPEEAIPCQSRASAPNSCAKIPIELDVPKGYPGNRIAEKAVKYQKLAPKHCGRITSCMQTASHRRES